MENFAVYMSVFEFYESCVETIIAHKIDQKAFVGHYLTESNAELVGSTIGAGAGSTLGLLGGPLTSLGFGAAGSILGGMVARYIKHFANQQHPPELMPQIEQASKLIEYLLAVSINLEERSKKSETLMGGSSAPTSSRELAMHDAIKGLHPDLTKLKDQLATLHDHLETWVKGKAKATDDAFKSHIHHGIMAGQQKPQSGFLKWARTWT